MQANRMPPSTPSCSVVLAPYLHLRHHPLQLRVVLIPLVLLVVRGACLVGHPPEGGGGVRTHRGQAM